LGTRIAWRHRLASLGAEVQESINHELNLLPQLEGQFMNIMEFSGFVVKAITC